MKLAALLVLTFFVLANGAVFHPEDHIDQLHDYNYFGVEELRRDLEDFEALGEKENPAFYQRINKCSECCDLFDRCEGLVANGFCRIYDKALVFRNCAKSCGMC